MGGYAGEGRFLVITWHHYAMHVAGDDRKRSISSIGMVTERPRSHAVAATIREKFALETCWQVIGKPLHHFPTIIRSIIFDRDICLLLQSSYKIFKDFKALNILNILKIFNITCIELIKIKCKNIRFKN